MRWPKPLLEYGKSDQVGVATFFNFNDDFLQLVAHVNGRRSVERPTWPILRELHCRFLLVETHHNLPITWLTAKWSLASSVCP
jgi:hypothetical protein